MVLKKNKKTHIILKKITHTTAKTKHYIYIDTYPYTIFFLQYYGNNTSIVQLFYDSIILL